MKRRMSPAVLPIFPWRVFRRYTFFSSHTANTSHVTQIAFTMSFFPRIAATRECFPDHYTLKRFKSRINTYLLTYPNKMCLFVCNPLPRVAIKKKLIEKKMTDDNIILLGSIYSLWIFRVFREYIGFYSRIRLLIYGMRFSNDKKTDRARWDILLVILLLPLILLLT